MPERGRPPPAGVAASRAVNRTPLTPKVAAKGSPVTPMARKPQGPPPMLAGASRQDRDDVSTPVSNFLTSNVTPRSGSRQHRVESISGTPTGTPMYEKSNDGWDTSSSVSGIQRSGLGIATPEQSGRPANMTGESSQAVDRDSKFFYASDARGKQQPQQQPARQAPPLQKQATFFYANGSTVDPGRRTSPPAAAPVQSIPPLNPDQQQSSSKFFYANGTPDSVGPVKQPFPQSSNTSSLSTTSRPAPQARPTSSYSITSGPGLYPRPASPIKQLGSPSQPFRSAMSPVSPNRVPMVSPPTAGDSWAGKGQRQVSQISIDTSPPQPRRQSTLESTTAATPLPLQPRLTLSPDPSEHISPPLSPLTVQSSLSMGSILRAVDAIDDREAEPSGVQSPTKSTYSDPAIQDLVVNARRERKVQDLEITNASLEAINRTLERQLRKQTSELRRFRRLSRSGRLSLNNSLPASRNVSAALTDPAVNLSDLSEYEESEDEEDDEDEFDDSPIGSPGDSIDSPAALRRKRDERRLQLDLSKHQEILVDSQKMNQSIKKCLNWTEMLIKEGQKALAYTVRVSEIQIGGRVLAPPDEDDEEERLSTINESDDPKALQDRDSGVELQAAEPVSKHLIT